MDNAIYTYNADLNGGSGGYASFVNGISSPAVGAGGIGDQIPQGQGFYVHSTGATLLTAQETHKVAANDPTFLRPSAVPSLLRLYLKTAGGFNDETALYFDQNASTNFDAAFDAYKVRGQDPFAPVIAFYEGGQALQISGVPLVSGTFTTELQTLTGYSGSYTLSVSDFTTLPKGTCLSIFDRATNQSFDLNTSDYVFNLMDTTTAPRFVLSISHTNLQVNSQLQSPSCAAPNSGSIVAQPVSNGPWSYYWSVNGQNVRTRLNKTTVDTLLNLTSGTVDLEVFSQGACDYSTSNFNLTSIQYPQASFVCADTVNVNLPFQLTNVSSNAANYSWSFGDGTSILNVQSPIHTYTSMGLYKVVLHVESATSCTDSLVKWLRVIDGSTGLSSETVSNNLIVRNLGNNVFAFHQPNASKTTNRILVISSNGQVIKDHQVPSSSELNYELNLNDLPGGIYSVSIFSDQQKNTVRLVVIK